jgi:hypothetical protein
MSDNYNLSNPPSYPEDRFLTEDEIAARQRTASLYRAQSPGDRVCSMDAYYLDRFGNPNEHLHTYDEYMQWRHDHVIADSDPWTNWMTADAWAQIAPFPPIPPGSVIPPMGWNYRVRVVPNGISQMEGLTSSLLGYTFVTKTPAPSPSSVIAGGLSTRITLVGQFQTVEAYVSPCNSLLGWAVNSISDLNRLTVAGNPNFSVYGQVVCDPLPYGIDGQNGFLVTAHVSVAPGQLGFRNVENGWSARLKSGNFTTDLDKGGSDWADATEQVLSLLMIEGYY